MASCSPLLLLVLCTLTVAEAQLKLFDMRASKLNSSFLGTPDAYVKVFCGSATLGETLVRHNEPNPWWEEEFAYLNARENDTMTLEVRDSDFWIDDVLGVCPQQIKLGTHEHECLLEAGGTLRYTYSLE